MQRLFLILILFIISFNTKAQVSIGYRYGIGNFGLYTELYSLKLDSYILPSHGLVLTYVNENNAGLQLEINYAQKGWKEFRDSMPDAYFSRRLDYIEIPVYSHFEIGHKMIRPVIIAGPYVAFKIKDTQSSNLFDDKISNENYPHYTYDTRDVDFGIKLGAGLRFNFTKRIAAFGEVHYDLDIAGGQDIFKDRPEKLQASRLTEISGVFGILWHIVPQKDKEKPKGYTPKENLYDFDY